MAARALDPADRWLYAEPRTPEELADARRKTVDLMNTLRDVYGGAPERFTCDGCDLAPRCTLAFDSYNTDGDCLYAK